jgi:hypothetical protein
MIRDSVLPDGGTGASARSVPPSEAERRLEKRLPKNTAATLAEWLALERKVADKRAEQARVRRDERDREAAAIKQRAKKSRGKPPRIEPEGKRLSGLMQSEAMNWVDGKTDAATISRRVCAEALSAGSWYYGECTPEMVEKFFETQAKDGLITW